MPPERRELYCFLPPLTMFKLTRGYSLVTIAAAAFAVFVSCGKQDGGTPHSAATPLPPGISQILTRSGPATLCFLDSIGKVKDPDKQNSVQVSGDTTFAIAGWAVDEVHKTLAGGVDLVIDQTPYSAHYGTPRKDVATHFNKPEYEPSGYDLAIAPGQLPKGQHSVSVRVISSDKKSYYQGPVVQFAVN